jgi:hypothetical protein
VMDRVFRSCRFSIVFPFGKVSTEPDQVHFSLPGQAPITRLGHYEIAAVLGVGGMGEVYGAHETKLNRDGAPNRASCTDS